MIERNDGLRIRNVTGTELREKRKKPKSCVNHGVVKFGSSLPLRGRAHFDQVKAVGVCQLQMAKKGKLPRRLICGDSGFIASAQTAGRQLFGFNSLSAGINRHVVGDERALQERSSEPS